MVVNDLFLKGRKEIRILDVGTGSGCIAIALKKYFPDANLTAIDISEEALEIAKTNAVLNKTGIRFIRSDILDKSEWSGIGKVDVIVSNPPYVPGSDRVFMQRNVLGFEPEKALFVPDSDPLVFYRMIAEFAELYLDLPGKLFFEIHENYGEEILRILRQKGFGNPLLIKDLRDKERFVTAINPSSRSSGRRT